MVRTAEKSSMSNSLEVGVKVVANHYVAAIVDTEWWLDEGFLAHFAEEIAEHLAAVIVERIQRSILGKCSIVSFKGNRLTGKYLRDFLHSILVHELSRAEASLEELRDLCIISTD